MLKAIWREGYRYKKAGVMLIDLVKASTVGNARFDRRDDPRSLSRMRALDGLTARFGRDAITLGRWQAAAVEAAERPAQPALYDALG